VRDGRVATQLEIQEARSFLRGAFDAWTALEPTVVERDRDAAAPVEDALTALDELVTRAEETPDDAASADAVQDAADHVASTLRGAVPDSWLESSSTTDLELVRTALTNLQSSARRGDWRAAEQSRVEAYGAFEFGPELRLRAIDPGLAVEVEELIWFGTAEHAGLAQLVSGHADEAAMAPTLDALDDRLAAVQDKLGTEATPGAIRTNSAIIVIREGMEAVLILAALTAGLAGAASSRWRRGILIGGLLALVATAITFVLAEALLDSLARFGARLEVVVSLVAIGVLLLILNWFVHKAYWTGWMAGFQKKKVSITGTARERREQEQAATAIDPDVRRASAIAQVGGLVVLGFTSIYREGFETVLFLQALVLDAGTLPVLEGAAIGLLAVTGLAVLTIGLQRRLPYRRMLIVTGVLIAVVLASMVGGTVQAMQAVGWMSVHPIGGLHVPSWMSTWLGVHPTWEAVALQFASIVFVIGSYVVAEWWQERQRARRRASRANDDGGRPRPRTPVRSEDDPRRSPAVQAAATADSPASTRLAPPKITE
jgi:high-affinity iron transporter